MVSAITNNKIAHYQIDTCTSCESVQKPEQGMDNKPFAPEDTVDISDDARKLFTNSHSEEGDLFKIEEMSRQEQTEVRKMKQRDTEVKAHEMAHIVAGGGVVQGGAHYEYKSGPDGKKYAVGGHVNIDTSAENNPEATVRKMQQVKKAALAPANPSGTDRAVAAKAARFEMKARADMREEQTEESDENSINEDPTIQMDELTPETSATNDSGGVTTM